MKKKKRICAVITRFGRELTNEGYAACTRMIDNSYPEGKGNGILFLAGGELNDLGNMISLMKKTPDLYLVMALEKGLRLLPSGKGTMEDYASVFEEAVNEKTFCTSWELLSAFLKEMEKHEPSVEKD